MVFGLVYRLVNAIVFLWVSLGTLGSYTIFAQAHMIAWMLLHYKPK